MKVTVFSDYICPFCYAAALRLERLAREVPVAVVWKGVEIHPETPDEGLPVSEELRQKLLHPQGAVQHFLAEEGVNISVSPVMPNTRLALEATEWAVEQGRGGQFQRAVFDCYWLQGEDIGRVAVLAAVARDVGLEPSALKLCVEQGRAQPRVRANREEATRQGVVAFPTFLFADRFLLEGVQAYDVLRRAVLKAAEGHGNLE